MATTRLLFACLAILLAVAPREPRAETRPLPKPDEVFAIAVKPQAKQLPAHFTPESLLRDLPSLKPAYLVQPIGGKVWSQSGVIVLKTGKVLFWRSYRDDVIAVETGGAPILYVRDP